MNRATWICTCFILGVLLSLTPSRASAEPTTAPASVVEEIVVQARKRAELLEDTPIAVTAIGSDELRQSNVERLDQIAPLAPNLQITSGLTGQNSDIVIRGVGRSSPSPAFDPGVGLYVDGVFLARAQASLLDVLDVQQIEVLRGPQGTLFGKNTVGGAVNVTTVKPSDELEAFVMLRPGNLASLDARTMINVPVDDEGKLAVRAAFSSRTRDGYVENPTTGLTASDVDSLSFLGSVRYDPVDTVSVLVSGSWSRSQTRSAGGQCLFVNPGGALAPLIPEFQDACDATSPFEWSSEVNNSVDNESWGAWGTIQWDAGDDIPALEGLYVRNVASWREQVSRTRVDVDLTFLPVVTLHSTGGPDPLAGTPGSYQQISEELQVGGSFWDERLSFVAGFFAYWETGEQGAINVVPAANSTTENLISTDNFTWALFSQATADVTDWLSLTAGLRYSRDGKSLDFEPHPAGQPIDPSMTGSGSETFPSWTPMASAAVYAPGSFLESTPLDHFMGYFTYSRGFKGGGFNGVVGASGGPLTPFEPETLDNFEIGIKTISFDQRVTMSLSLFYGLYDDIQVNTLMVEETPAGPVTSSVTLNAAKAKTKGVELDFRAVPIDALVLTGNLGLVRAVYDEFSGLSDLTGALVDRSGQTFADVPPFGSFLAIQYSLPLQTDVQWLEGWITPRLEWRYQAAVSRAGPELPEARQPHFNLINARLSYDFFSDRAQVALWGRNLTNETYFTASQSLAPFFGSLNNYYAPPRTFGGELSYSF